MESLSADDLGDLEIWLAGASDADAREMFGDREDARAVAQLVGRYAAHREAAVRARGLRAQTHREVCEHLYGQLPKEVRW